MSWLKDRVILITGGASGLGREVAVQAAEVGAKVAIMDRHAERLEATRADVARIAGDCLALRSDVTSEEQVVGAVREVVAKWGQLDTVVNSAGVFYGGPITTTPTLGTASPPSRLIIAHSTAHVRRPVRPPNRTCCGAVDVLE